MDISILPRLGHFFLALTVKKKTRCVINNSDIFKYHFLGLIMKGVP